MNKRVLAVGIALILGLSSLLAVLYTFEGLFTPREVWRVHFNETVKKVWWDKNTSAITILYGDGSWVQEVGVNRNIPLNNFTIPSVGEVK